LQFFFRDHFFKLMVLRHHRAEIRSEICIDSTGLFPLSLHLITYFQGNWHVSKGRNVGFRVVDRTLAPLNCLRH
jgi:hypothetical protein